METLRAYEERVAEHGIGLPFEPRHKVALDYEYEDWKGLVGLDGYAWPNQPVIGHANIFRRKRSSMRRSR